MIPWEYLEHLGTFHHFWYGNGNFCYTVVDERGFTYRLQFEFPPENMETKEYIFSSNADSLRTINTGHDRVLYRTIGNAEYVYNFGKLYLIYLNVGAYQVHIASGFDAYPETGPETVMSRLLDVNQAENEVKALSDACAKKLKSKQK